MYSSGKSYVSGLIQGGGRYLGGATSNLVQKGTRFNRNVTMSAKTYDISGDVGIDVVENFQDKSFVRSTSASMLASA